MEFWVQTTIISTLIGLLIYIWQQQIKTGERERRKIKEDLIAATKKAEDHYKQCNEVPKSLLLEKLNNLCEKQDDYQEEAINRFNRIDQSHDGIYQRLNKTEVSLARLQAITENRK